MSPEVNGRTPLRIDEALRTRMRELRHDLHEHPEIGYELPRTQAKVLEAIADLDGLEVITGQRQSSIIVILRAADSGPETPLVLLRGDMDGLPVEENVEVEWVSKEPGRMHACGHDVHTAGLVGALRLLHANREQLGCDVLCMFQPAEEAYVGAKWMIEDGLLVAGGKPIAAAFGAHVFSGMFAPRTWHLRGGSLMAGCDEIRAVIRGKGGHGSTPHLALDPVPVACEIGVALNTLVARRFGPFEPVVATLGSLTAGTDSVVIPETAEMRISLRSFTPETKERLLADVTRFIRSVAEAHEMGAEIEVMPDYPVTVNDPGEADYAGQVIDAVFGPEARHELEHPLSGSEDFAHVLAEVPGAYVFVGAEPIGDAAESNHSPRASFGDTALDDIAEFLANAAWLRV